MDVFAKPRSRGDLPMLHTQQAMRNIKSLARRRRDIWCEFREPGKGSGFSGAEPAADILLGRTKVAIQATGAGREGDLGFGADQPHAFEIVTDVNLILSPQSRVAVPAFFPNWGAEVEYELGALITASQVQMGAMRIWEAVQGGDSDYFEPDWSGSHGANVEDGTVLWRPHGVATFYEIVGIDHARSNLYENLYFAKTIE
jgi:hypothetical protein